MTLIDVYHRLPYPLRVLAASARGYALRWWRYGPETEQLVQAALERETWSAEKLNAYQQERLAHMLHHAAREVPFYQNEWNQRRKKGDHSAWDLLENWPVLKKASVRDHPRAFLFDRFQQQCLFEEHTSGTTGTPLTIWQDRTALIEWYALFEARWRRWNGVHRNTRWAILGGQVVSPINASRPPYWVWNQAFHQLYLSSYHLNIRTVSDYLNAMDRYQVEYLYGYPSMMENLAGLAHEAGLTAPVLKVAISNAEPLFDHQVSQISRVFHCPVRNTYGLSELVCGASECSAGALHLWPEAGLVEVLADEADTPVTSGQTGRLIATGCINPAMPLIRYEAGDRGSLGKLPCACGRCLPVLAAVEGRMDDVITTPDGRRIGRLDPVFKADMPIREAQIIQETSNCITVKYVAAPGLQQKHLNDLQNRLMDRLGAMQITLTEVESISRGPNGKFRAVISKIH